MEQTASVWDVNPAGMPSVFVLMSVDTLKVGLIGA